MSVVTTHAVYQPTGSPAPDLSWGDMLSIANLSLAGGSSFFRPGPPARSALYGASELCPAHDLSTVNGTHVYVP